MIDPRRSLYPRPQLDQVREPEADTSHAIMLEMIGVGKRVLELGCSNGQMSRLLKQRNCQVTGLDVDPLAAAEARAFCEEVIVADLDARPLVDLLPGTPFDVAVFGDVLEHLRDPWRILDETRAFLAPGSFAVLSIPNVAHGSVRLALLQGSFDYQPQGLLDSTHLRFFTLRTVQELCMRSGYRIEEVRRTKADMFAATDLLPHVDPADFDPELLAQIRQDPEHDTVQFVVKAVPLGDEEKVSAMVSRVSALELELRGSKEKAERLASELEASRTEAAFLVTFNNQLSAERQAVEAELDGVRAQAESERETFAAAFEEHRSIVEAEVRDELNQLAEEAGEQRTAIVELNAALAYAQQARAELSADLRYFQAKLEELEGVRDRASDLERQHALLSSAFDDALRSASELESALRDERVRSAETEESLARELVQRRNSELEAGRLETELRALTGRRSELETEAARLRDRCERLEAELRAAREERATFEASVARLHHAGVERTRLELQRVLEEIALTDAAIQETYRSRLWTLRRLLSLARKRSR